MPNFTFLLSPAEEKKPGGNPFAPDMFDYRSSDTFNYFNDLNPERRALIDWLHEMIKSSGEKALEDVFGVSGEVLKEVLKVVEDIYSAPLMAALDRYDPGVLFTAMKFANLSTGAQRRLLENGVIFSGLFGLLRPDDLIPNYRLGLKATIPGVGSVADYWRPHLSRHLNEIVKERFVWDLLPDTLRAVWDDHKTYAQRIQVQFFVRKNGKWTRVQKDEQALCGKLVSFIVQETVQTVAPLQEWRHPAGFSYDEGLSSFDEENKAAIIAMVRR